MAPQISWLMRGLCAAALVVAGCADEGGEARAGQHASRPVSVELVELYSEPLRDVVALTGQFEAENSVLVKPEVSGVIESVEFEEGGPLDAGDILFRLRDAEQRARLAEARAEMTLAQDVYNRARRLEKRDVSSQARRAETAAELERARARVDLARLELERTQIRVAFDSVAGRRRVSPGDRVTPEDALVEVVAIDRLQLVFAIQELGVPLARVGAPVAARVAAWPGERFPGTVFFVAPSLDPRTRRLILKAWVDNRDHRLKPGMFANVDVEIARKDAVLMVPEAALVYDRHGVYVWRAGESERAEKVPVETGLRQQGRVEVVAGLSVGDRVVSAGTHKVMAGSVLRDPSAAAPAQAGGETAAASPGQAS